MNCDQANELCAEYVTGSLAESLRAEVDAHLAGCPRCRQEIKGLVAVWTGLSLLPQEEPSRDLDARITSMLQGFRQGLEAAKRTPASHSKMTSWLGSLWPARPALQFAFGVALLAIGVLIGQLEVQWRPGAPRAVADQTALAEMRGELTSLKVQVALALLEQQSASERLRGVEWSGRLTQPQDQVLVALFRTLDSDPNVNVRLAAVDALKQFAGQARVRRAFLDLLPHQQSPLVQAELIQSMVELEDKEAVPVLKALLQKPEINDSVRQRAEWGLSQL